MGRAVQTHHICYKPEITVNLFSGEHEILTKLSWYERKTVSAGFIRALKSWIALNEHRAKELEIEK